jgi:hypothetical protein
MLHLVLHVVQVKVLQALAMLGVIFELGAAKSSVAMRPSSSTHGCFPTNRAIDLELF